MEIEKFCGSKTTIFSGLKTLDFCVTIENLTGAYWSLSQKIVRKYVFELFCYKISRGIHGERRNQ